MTGTVRLLGNGRLRIEFPFSPHLQGIMRRLRGAWFSRNEKGRPGWNCPYIPYNVAILLSKFTDIGPGIVFDPHVNVKLPKATANTKLLTAKDIPLKGLLNFQVEGVSFAESLKGLALIADDPGLGKTFEAMGWLSLHPNAWPVVIVCPASVKLYWKRQIRKHLKLRSLVCFGSSPDLQDLKPRKIIIINYDIITGWLDWLRAQKPVVLILDEAHYAKSKTAVRTQAVIGLRKVVKYVIGLTGTPIINRPMDLYHIVNLIRPKLLPSWWDFGLRYCGMRFNGHSWDTTRATHSDELHQLLTGSVMIRRLKKEVLKDLPDKTRTVIPMELSNRGDYEQAEENFTEWAAGQSSKEMIGPSLTNALARVEGLKQLCTTLKMDSAIEWVRDFLATDEKLVLFATHRETVRRFMEAFNGVAVQLDGSTPPKRRQEVVDRFQKDGRVRLFVGNIVAAGTGITLTAASNTAFIELAWSPSVHDQAEDRVHRIGQKEAVTAWYLLAPNTIEDRIAKILERKRKVINKIVDGRTMSHQSTLLTLLREYNNAD